MNRYRNQLPTLALLLTACASPQSTPTPPTETAPVTAVATPDGRDLYGRVCVTCHGEKGDGRGLEQQLFSFGAPEADWKNGPTADGILRTLAEGVHATSMQPFPEFGDAEQRAIAAYVLELRAALQAEAP